MGSNVLIPESNHSAWCSYISDTECHKTASQLFKQLLLPGAMPFENLMDKFQIKYRVEHIPSDFFKAST